MSITGRQNSPSNTTPSVSKQKKKARNTDVTSGGGCNINKKDGMCTEHGVKSTRIEVTSKVWKNLGAKKGYGYAYKKVTKFICRSRNIPLGAPNIEPKNPILSHVANNTVDVDESESHVLMDNSLRGLENSDFGGIERERKSSGAL